MLSGYAVWIAGWIATACLRKWQGLVLLLNYSTWTISLAWFSGYSGKQLPPLRILLGWIFIEFFSFLHYHHRWSARCRSISKPFQRSLAHDMKWNVSPRSLPVRHRRWRRFRTNGVRRGSRESGYCLTTAGVRRLRRSLPESLSAVLCSLDCRAASVVLFSRAIRHSLMFVTTVSEVGGNSSCSLGFIACSSIALIEAPDRFWLPSSGCPHRCSASDNVISRLLYISLSPPFMHGSLGICLALQFSGLFRSFFSVLLIEDISTSEWK